MRGGSQRTEKPKPGPSHITFFVDVPQTEVARIVGSKGSNIHRIQDEAGCFIRSPPRDVEAHEDGTVSFQLRGLAKACFEGARLIEEFLEDRIPFSVAEVNLGKPGDVALLIGPNGSGIRHVMSETNTKLSTRPREERSDLIIIEGLPADVARAYELMLDVIKKAKKDAEEPYRSSRSVAKPSERNDAKKNGASVDHAGKEQHQQQHQHHGVKPEKSNSNSNVPEVNATAAGSEKKQRKEKGEPKAKKVGKKPASGNDNNQNAKDKGQREWGAPKNPKFSGKAKEEETAEGGANAATEKEAAVPEMQIEIPFPPEKAGMLFGKEGNRIKHIKRKSKASVFIDTKANVVKISGSVDSVKIAEDLVRHALSATPKDKSENKGNDNNNNNEQPQQQQGQTEEQSQPQQQKEQEGSKAEEKQ